MQMLKLAASSDFRNAAQKVVTELKNAGVDLTSQVEQPFPSQMQSDQVCRMQ